MVDQGFELHPGAALDIAGIWEFTSKDDPLAAKRVREDILTAPASGHRRTDLSSRPLRFQTVRKYLVAYAPDEKPLLVVAVLQGRRSPRVIAAILRGRK